MRHAAAALLFVLVVSASAQTTTIPASGTARRIIRAASLPATCSVSDVYFKTAATVGQYLCLTANNWSAVTIGGITQADADLRYLQLAGGTMTGGALGKAGTAASVSWGFVGEADTGMFLSGANAIGFATDGTERWLINSSGALNPLASNTYDIGGSTTIRDIGIGRSAIFSGSTSGTTSLAATAIAGTTALILPAVNDTLVGKATTDTLTNKSVALGANTLTGTIAEFNTAVTDADFATLGGTETLAAKTLTSPIFSGNYTWAGGSTYTVDTSVANTVDIFNQNTTGNATLRLFRRRADASNYQLAAFGWGTDEFTISVVKAGSENQPTLTLRTAGVIALQVGATQVVTLPVLAITAGAMTSVVECSLPSCLTCRTWSNAQVAALAGTAGDIAFGTLPAKSIVRNAYVVITGAAVGPTTVTVSVGRTSASYIDYIVASDAKAAANTVYGDASGERGTNLTTYDLPAYTGTTLVNAHFISTGANLSTTTGSTGMVCVATDRLP